MPTNRTANLVNLARAQLMALDRARVETSMPTATLEMLLKGVVELGEAQYPQNQQIEDSAAKVFTKKSATLAAALKDRDDGERG